MTSIKQFRHALTAWKIPALASQACWRLLDTDGSKTIDLPELKRFLKALEGLDLDDPLTNSRVIFRLADSNGNEQLEPDELAKFYAAVHPHSKSPLTEAKFKSILAGMGKKFLNFEEFIACRFDNLPKDADDEAVGVDDAKKKKGAPGPEKEHHHHHHHKEEAGPAKKEHHHHHSAKEGSGAAPKRPATVGGASSRDWGEDDAGGEEDDQRWTPRMTQACCDNFNRMGGSTTGEKEFQQVLSAMQLSHMLAGEIYQLLNRKGTGIIGVDQLRHLLTKLEGHKVWRPGACDRVLFSMIDANDNGVLDASELAFYCQVTGAKGTEAEFKTALAGADGWDFDQFKAWRKR